MKFEIQDEFYLNIIYEVYIFLISLHSSKFKTNTTPSWGAI